MCLLEIDLSVAVLMSLKTFLALGDTDAAMSNDWTKARCVLANW